MKKETVLDQIEYNANIIKELSQNKSGDQLYYLKKLEEYKKIYKKIVFYKNKYKSDWEKEMLKYIKIRLEKEKNSSTKDDCAIDVYIIAEKIIECSLKGINKVRLPKINFIEADKKDIMESKNFIIFDFETTGLSSKWDDIIEIGALKLIYNEETGFFEKRGKFNTLVQPRKIKGKIKKIKNSHIHGINDDMVKKSPNIFKILPNFINFIDEKSILVAHNFNFDKRFLQDKINFLNKFDFEIRIKNKVMDTLKLSRELLPDLKNKKLETIAQHFGLNIEGNHRAYKDCETTSLILIELLKIQKNKNKTI